MKILTLEDDGSKFIVFIPTGLLFFFFFEFNGQGSEHIHGANPFHLQLFNFFNNKIREVRVGRIIYGIFCFIFVVVALKIYNFELF